MAAQFAAAQRQAEAGRMRAAKEIWSAGVPCEGTLAQRYLEAQTGSAINFDKSSRTLRFHPSVWHGPSRSHMPAVLARVMAPNGTRLGVHQIFIDEAGERRAPVTPDWITVGPSIFGAVRLGPPRSLIAVSVQIEDALAIRAATGLTVFAALSISALRRLALPSHPIAETVLISVGSNPNRLAAAKAAASRFEAQGRAVSVILPEQSDEVFSRPLRSVAR